MADNENTVKDKPLHWGSSKLLREVERILMRVGKVSHKPIYKKIKSPPEMSPKITQLEIPVPLLDSVGNSYVFSYFIE